MSNELQETKINRLAMSFANSIEQSISEVTSSIDTAEAKRLTISLFVAGNSALEGQGIPWSAVDTNKFAVDALRIVTLGLDASNNEAYAIPYPNRKTGKTELQCSPSAWGLRKLVQQYSIGKPIEDIKAFAIKEGDKFTVKRTPKDDIWTYEEDVFGEGKTRGYVSIVIYSDGTSSVMTHSLQDINKRRQASKAPNSPAWTKWFDEMAIAKAMRRHCKKIAYKLPYDKEKAFHDLDDDKAVERKVTEMKDVTEVEANQIPLQSAAVVPEEEQEPETQAEPRITQSDADGFEYQDSLVGQQTFDEMDAGW